MDSFVVKDGQLCLAMPAALGLPAVDDEVHELLKWFGFVTPMGHLDQALQSHGNGLWAAANGQIRSFVMGLIDEIAEKLPPEHGVAAARRRALELAAPAPKACYLAWNRTLPNKTAL